MAAWLLCLPRLTHLAGMIHFTGAFVGSTIWPVAAGLYWRKSNPAGATLAMILGSGLGLMSYFLVGWYVAALMGAAVSMAIVIISTLVKQKEFDFIRLREDEAEAHA